MEMKTAQQALGVAQAIGILAGLATIIAKAEAFKEKFGNPLTAQLILNDPHKTQTIINIDIVMPQLKDRCLELLRQLDQEHGVSCSAMMQEIQQQVDEFINSFQS